MGSWGRWGGGDCADNDKSIFFFDGTGVEVNMFAAGELGPVERLVVSSRMRKGRGYHPQFAVC